MISIEDPKYVTEIVAPLIQIHVDWKHLVFIGHVQALVGYHRLLTKSSDYLASIILQNSFNDQFSFLFLHDTSKIFKSTGSLAIMNRPMTAYVP